jgi:hypothetical protein
MKTTILTSEKISKIFFLKGQELALKKQSIEAVEVAVALRHTKLAEQATKVAEECAERLAAKHAEVLSMLEG